MHTLAMLLLMVNVSAVEQTYGPYARPSTGNVHAIAVAEKRALLAWSEVSSATGRAVIRTAMLDSSGRALAPIATFAAARSHADAVAPAVASDGSRFLVTWIEIAHTDVVRGVALDPSGTPLRSPASYGLEAAMRVAPVAPIAAWNGSAYQVWGPNSTYRVNADGGFGAITDGATRPPSAVAPDHRLAYVSTSVFTQPGCWFMQCFPSKYRINWTAGGTTGTAWVGNDPISTPVMAAAGGKFAIAWATRYDVSYMLTGGASHFVHAAAEMHVPPAVACDDTECVVAYGVASGDVHAVAFPIARPHAMEMFVVAASERRENAPQVHVLHSGRFLVTYTSESGGGAMLNGRIVTLGESKRRAVR